MIGPRGDIEWVPVCRERRFFKRHVHEAAFLIIKSAEGSPGWYPETSGLPCKFCGAHYSTKHKAWFLIIPPTEEEIAQFEKEKQALLDRLRRGKLRRLLDRAKL